VRFFAKGGSRDSAEGGVCLRFAALHDPVTDEILYLHHHEHRTVANQATQRAGEELGWLDRGCR